MLNLKIKFNVECGGDLESRLSRQFRTPKSSLLSFDVTLVREPHLTVEVLAETFEKISSQELNVEVRKKKNSAYFTFLKIGGRLVIGISNAIQAGV